MQELSSLATLTESAIPSLVAKEQVCTLLSRPLGSVTMAMNFLMICEATDELVEGIKEKQDIQLRGAHAPRSEWHCSVS